MGSPYRLRPRELWRLHLAEGAGYVRRRIAVRSGSGWRRCEVYVATHIDPDLRPFDWYRRLILAGLLENGIGGTMMQQVLETPALPDPRPFRPARLRAERALRRAGRLSPTLGQRL
jgi:gamma-glutamylcyclotransferase